MRMPQRAPSPSSERKRGTSGASTTGCRSDEAASDARRPDRRGPRARPLGAAAILTRNLLIYGLGGVIVPFIGIKLIDLAVAALHLA